VNELENELGQKIVARSRKLFIALQRHRERYVRAWCAKFGINSPELLGKLHLVEQHHDDGRITLHVEVRVGACPYCGRE